MNLRKKIEQLRQKPEKERMRYVQISVFVSMFFIVLLWLISFSLFGQKNNTASILDLIKSEEMEDIKTQKESLEDATKKLKELPTKIQGNIPANKSEE